jgi:hypothetical protein
MQTEDVVSRSFMRRCCINKQLTRPHGPQLAEFPFILAVSFFGEFSTKLENNVLIDFATFICLSAWNH